MTCNIAALMELVQLLSKVEFGDSGIGHVPESARGCRVFAWARLDGVPPALDNRGSGAALAGRCQFPISLEELVVSRQDPRDHRFMRNPFITQECERLRLPQNVIETTLVQTYSQNAEDIIIEGLLVALAARGWPLDNIFYIDIGGNHPIQTSNTYLFYKKYNAQGVIVEADPDLIPNLQQVRPRDTVVHGAVSSKTGTTATLNIAYAKELSSLEVDHIKTFSSWGELSKIERSIEVPNIHIEDLMGKYTKCPLHYLSIDVEGLDLDLLEGINFNKHRPWVVSCEPSSNFRASNPGLIYELMARNGYLLAARTPVNFIFLDKRFS